MLSQASSLKPGAGNDAHHIYSASWLELKPKEIRLLEISPDTALLARIVCKLLENLLISNKLPYKALSYAWREGNTRAESEGIIFTKVGEDEDEDENDVRV